MLCSAALGVVLLAVSSSCRTVPRAHVAALSSATWVEPSETTAFLKGRLDLSLLAQPPGADAALSGCSVRPPEQKVFTPLAEGVGGRLALLGNLGDGTCGVRVQPVADGDDGAWTLMAVFKSDGSAASAVATVHVKAFSASAVPEHSSVSEGDSFSLRLGTLSTSPPWSSCSVVLPTGRFVELTGAQGGRVTLDGDLTSGKCVARVTGAAAEDEGRWVLEATEKGTGVVQRGAASVTVYKLEVEVLPARAVAVQGEAVLLRLVFSGALTGRHPWTGCQAVRPDGGVVLLAGTPAASDAQHVRDDTVKPAAGETDLGRSVCAALVGPLEARHAGVWRLEALEAPEGGALTTRSARAVLDVKGPYRPSAATVTLAPGLRGALLDCGPADALSCALRDPTGSETAFRGPCRLQLDRVRERHRGVWACTALLAGYARPVNDTVMLKLAEPAHAETGVARSGDGVVLTCRLAGSSPCPHRGAASCLWEPPAGRPPLLLREAVQALGADERFAYAGRGLRSCDCSLAVRAPPRPEDVGVWRCVIGLADSRTRGGFVAVAEGAQGDAESRRPRAEAVPSALPLLTPSSGVVAPGAPLTVGCRAERPLAYCWLRTPRGELLTLDEEWRSADGGAKYAGLGLELGECAVSVRAATANHSGTWRCGLGVAGTGQPAPDVELALGVVVSESLLVAVRPDVTAVDGEPATLHCRTALAEGLRHCRFQRPDGSSIHLADEGPATSRSSGAGGRFRYDGLDDGLAGGVCGIAISSLAEEDFGEWTCAVALAGDSAGKEHKAGIWLRAPEEDFAEATLIGAGVALLGVAAITMVVIGGRHYRRTRSARPRRRDGSSASWLSDDDEDDRALELRQARHSPSPSSSSASTRRTRSSTTRVSGLATTRLPARTRRSAGTGGRARPPRSSGSEIADVLAETRVGDDADSGEGAAGAREGAPRGSPGGNDETPPFPFSRKRQ